MLMLRRNYLRVLRCEVLTKIVRFAKNFTLSFFAVVLVGVGGCAKPDTPIIDAGRLGRVTLVGAGVPRFAESRGEAMSQWLADAAINAYSRPDLIPESHVLSRSQALAQRDALMRRKNAVLWIGHATFLIRLGGINILTDPVFSDYASPFPPLGPKRYQPPSLAVEDLPEIDFILLSHNHYDHLDVTSLSALAQRFTHARILVPIGTESYASDAGFTQIRSVRPGSEMRIGPVAVMALPAYHVARRSDLDAFATPSLAWSLRTGDGASVFFGGDTAYGPIFKRMRRLLGPHHVALVSIGAYEPLKGGQHVHAIPEEAVRLAHDVGAKTAIGTHWGTFPLSPEPPMEPAFRFKRAGGRFAKVLRIGEMLPM